MKVIKGIKNGTGSYPQSLRVDSLGYFCLLLSHQSQISPAGPPWKIRKGRWARERERERERERVHIKQHVAAAEQRQQD